MLVRAELARLGLGLANLLQLIELGPCITCGLLWLNCSTLLKKYCQWGLLLGPV